MSLGTEGYRPNWDSSLQLLGPKSSALTTEPRHLSVILAMRITRGHEGTGSVILNLKNVQAKKAAIEISRILVRVPDASSRKVRTLHSPQYGML